VLSSYRPIAELSQYFSIFFSIVQSQHTQQLSQQAINYEKRKSQKPIKEENLQVFMLKLTVPLVSLCSTCQREKV
jgi:hypothetical protein